jgi:hypothetical protein
MEGHSKNQCWQASETWVIRRHSEKMLPAYDALILPQVHGLLDGLAKLYKKRGMKPVYLFEHTNSRGKNYSKGEPIKNFRTRMEIYVGGDVFGCGEREHHNPKIRSLRLCVLTTSPKD